MKKHQQNAKLKVSKETLLRLNLSAPQDLTQANGGDVGDHGSQGGVSCHHSCFYSDCVCL